MWGREEKILVERQRFWRDDVPIWRRRVESRASSNHPKWGRKRRGTWFLKGWFEEWKSVGGEIWEKSLVWRRRDGELLVWWEEEDEGLSRLKKKFPIRRERPKGFDKIVRLPKGRPWGSTHGIEKFKRMMEQFRKNLKLWEKDVYLSIDHVNDSFKLLSSQKNKNWAQ